MDKPTLNIHPNPRWLHMIPHSHEFANRACFFPGNPYNLDRMDIPTQVRLTRSASVKGLLVLATGLFLVGWLLNTPNGLLGKADAIGYAVCHRIDLRSFHLGVRQLPLCARCTGIYLGALVGLGYQLVFSRRRVGLPSRPVIAGLSLIVIAFGLDGINSFLSLIHGAPHAYEPSNILRLFTGTGLGLAIAMALYPSFNQTVWINYDDQRVIPDFRSLGWLIGLGVLIDILVLTENPLILYPLALTSAAGVLIVLSMIYTLVLVMLLRVENRFNHVRQLVPHLLGGMIIAIIQIGLFDVVRYLLTGTWQGFQIG